MRASARGAWSTTSPASASSARMLAIVNPPRWEIGHVGWFQEFWCLRQGSEARPSILPNADALYNSATVPHDTRWSLPLPSFGETLAYREEVLERVIKRLKAATPTRTSSSSRCATRTCTPRRSTTRARRSAIPPRQAWSPVRTCPRAGDAERPAALFRLGAAPDDGFVFDNEKWSHPVVLEPFRMRARLRDQRRVRGVREGGRQGAALLEGRQAAPLRPLDRRSRPTSR